MDPLVWATLLLVVGLTLVLLEILVPSGGMLGFLSISSLVGGVILAFYHRGAQVGFLFLTIAVVGVPAAIALGFRWWPKTPMGRRILLEVPSSEDVLPDNPLRSLVGKYGVAKTVMLPSGAVVIDGRSIDALSEGESIEAGQRVQVIEVHGNRVVVRPVEEIPESAPNDLLSQPIESLGLDSLEDPLA